MSYVATIIDSIVEIILLFITPILGRIVRWPLDACSSSRTRVLIHVARVEFTTELLKFLQVHSSHRTTGSLQTLLEVLTSYLRNRVEVLGLTSLGNQSLHPGFSLNSLHHTTSTSLTAALAAFWQISVISAPEKPSVRPETKLRSTSLEMGVFLKLAFRMLSLDGWSGRGM